MKRKKSRITKKYISGDLMKKVENNEHLINESILRGTKSSETLKNQMNSINAQVGSNINLITGLVNVIDYGAAGNWDGSNGTDNLNAFNNAVASLPISGGVIMVPPGDYWLSDNWVIDHDNVYLFLMSGCTVRTTTITTTGGTIGFIGSTRRKNCGVFGGGTVRNTVPVGTADIMKVNGIGVSNYTRFYIENINIPECSRKAITCQADVDQIYILNNEIGNSVNYGISVESAGGEGCSLAHIENNHISCSGESAIIVTGDGLGNSCKDIYINSNDIDSSADNGINVYDGKYVHVNNNNIKSAAIGINVSTCDVLTVKNNHVINSSKQGIQVYNCRITEDIEGNKVISSSNSSVGEYDAIIVSLCPNNPRINGNTVIGANHAYALNCTSIGSGKEAISTDNVFNAGVKGVTAYGGWMPLIINDIVDGEPFMAINKCRSAYLNAMPTSGTWYVGDTIINTLPTGNFEGWKCMVRGTFGTLNRVTANATTGQQTVSVNDTTNLKVGMIITISGLIGVKKIIAINGKVLTLDGTNTATVANATVSYSAPIFKNYGNISS